MSTQWMKQTLIASVLTVLMTLPAVAQQRRPQGPAKPPSGTPGKFEVPQKLGPAFKNAIEAHKAVIRAQIAALQALKKLNLEVKGYQGGRASEGWNQMSPDAKAKIGEKGGATQGPQSQKEKLSEGNPFGLQGGAPKQQKVSEANPFAFQSSQQAEDAFFKLVTLILPAVQNFAYDTTGGKKMRMSTTHGSKSSYRGGGGSGGRVNFDAQAVSKEPDGALGDLNTQLNLLPVLSKSK